MRQFPIEHRGQPLSVDKKIAHTEVPMHEAVGCRLRTVLGQPAEGQFEDRVGGAKLPVKTLLLIQQLLGILPRQRHRQGINVRTVDARQLGRTLTAEPVSGHSVLGLVEQPCGQRLSRYAGHDEALPQRAIGGEFPDNLGHLQTLPMEMANKPGLGSQ